MKRDGFILTTVLMLLALAACQRSPSPAAPSPVMTEAVATGEGAGTATRSAPTSTSTQAATVVREGLPEPSDAGAPVLPEMATSTPPPADELQTIDAFVAHLEKTYSISRLNSDAVRAALRPLVARDFSFTVYPTGRPAYMDSQQQVLGHLSFGMFRPADPLFIVENIEGHLPPGVSPEAFYTGEQPLAAVVYSSGWGQDGTSEALLYLTRQQGALRWAGLALSRDNFTPLPEMQTVAPPPGLVYRLQDEWRQVQGDGAARLLLTHPGPLSFNAGASHALYAEQGEQSLTLFDFTGDGPAISRTLSIDFSLMHGSWSIPWLDEQTAILMVTEPGAGFTQGSTGQMALLDIVSGALERLPPELSIYAHPAPTAAGAIFYDSQRDGAHVWRQGAATPLALRQMAGLEYEPFYPSPSPDGAKVVARGGWPDDPDLTGYLLFDLERQAARPVLGYSPPGTDAILPSGVFWQPASEWLALQPQTGDELQTGVWMMRADGSERRFLGVGTSNPLWLQAGARLLFNATIDGEERLQMLDLESGERLWLDAPVGATPVAAPALPTATDDAAPTATTTATAIPTSELAALAEPPLLYAYQGDIWRFDVASGATENVTQTEERLESAPRWLPGNTQQFVAGSFAVAEAGPSPGYLTLIGFDGGYELLDDEGSMTAPPALLAAPLSFEPQSRGLWLFDLQGEKRRLTDQAPRLSHTPNPALSPDGRRLAFSTSAFDAVGVINIGEWQPHFWQPPDSVAAVGWTTMAPR